MTIPVATDSLQKYNHKDQQQERHCVLGYSEILNMKQTGKWGSKYSRKEKNIKAQKEPREQIRD